MLQRFRIIFKTSSLSARGECYSSRPKAWLLTLAQKTLSSNCGTHLCRLLLVLLLCSHSHDTLNSSIDPFEYVLTTRYKAPLCLLQNVKGPIISVCIAYVRDGKLQNCKLLSPDRVVPDIYTLNEGVGGSPVEVYIHLKIMEIAQDVSDPKQPFGELQRER